MRTLTNESDGAERRVITQAIMAAILYSVMQWRPEVRESLDAKDMAESCAADAEEIWEAVAARNET